MPTTFILLNLLVIAAQTLCFGQQYKGSRTNSLQSVRKVYPWHKNITATVFWIGEAPAGANKTPNYASSWDVNWTKSYGGYDNPSPRERIGYRPRAFTPQQNPFYVALPYNDVKGGRLHKPEASLVIPWFHALNPRSGHSVCKGKWLQILHDGKSCYAQWEDCGPWTTTDYQYVFLGKRPKNRKNGGAGIDVSPAIRDYLGLKSGEKCHWRFVPYYRIPRGPWSEYGRNNPFRNPSMNFERRVK